MTTPSTQLASLFQFSADDGASLSPRYNIAPSQPLACVRAPEGKCECVEVTWGLVPAWAKDRYAGGGLINACAETAATRPSFRVSFRRRRCLIPADGFYEWKHVGKRKEPFLIRLKEEGPFAFAGLWDRCELSDGKVLETAAILTTQANELIRSIHERMPVILRPEHHQRWLDPNVGKPELLSPLLVPCEAEAMALLPVSFWVNDARHEGPRCLEGRVESEASLF